MVRVRLIVGNGRVLVKSEWAVVVALHVRAGDQGVAGVSVAGTRGDSLIGRK